MSSLIRTLSHLFHPQRSNNHRPRVLHPEALTYFSLIVIGFVLLLRLSATTAGSILGYASSITVEHVVELTNFERAKAGLPPLSVNTRLSEAALSKGQDMFSNQYWAHTSPSGKEPWLFITEAGYSYRVAGENLARDFGYTEEMVSAWMASPTHRANIMNPRYEEIGIAVINGTLQGIETTLVVQMFGSPRVLAQTTSPRAVTTEQPVVFQPTSAETRAADAGADETAQTTQPQLAPSILEGIPQASLIPQAVSREPVVLAGVVVPQGLLASPLVSPLELMKAFFLAIVMLLLGTLIYDFFVAQSRRTIRFVGKNLAHIMLLSVVAFLLVFFKGGIIG